MPVGKMNEAERLATQKKLLLAASLIEDLDLDGLRRSIESFEETWTVFDTSTGSTKTKEQLMRLVSGAQLFKSALPKEGEGDDSKVPRRGAS